ncbi:mucin-binding lectin 1 [Coprinopsis sp. MPI-PUGE-AT-0042]|nr:mucin-binding lectin 1 [Coprinopsis sp. MPI-PUGE-AT-0042]
MAETQIFMSDTQLAVITRGPGVLSLLTWENTNDCPRVVGAVPTNNTGLTRYMLSFSHNFLHFAFKWDGEGEAVYQIGSGLERKPVGRDWTAASTVHWGASSVVTEDVSAHVSGALNRDGRTTAWIIPDTL